MHEYIVVFMQLVHIYQEIKTRMKFEWIQNKIIPFNFGLACVQDDYLNPGLVEILSKKLQKRKRAKMFKVFNSDIVQIRKCLTLGNLNLCYQNIPK